MLTDLQCRRAKGREAAYKMADSRGLYLHVSTTGYRTWRWKYRWLKAEKKLTFGPYPEVTLEQAREMREAARKVHRSGRDPGVERRQRAAEQALEADTTFEAVALRWMAGKRWKPRYATQVRQRFDSDVFPAIGMLPIAEVTSALILHSVLRPIEARGAHEIAHRIRQHASDIFVFAIGNGWAQTDPALVVRKALTAVHHGRRPAVIRIEDAQRVLRVTEAMPAYAVTKLAGRLLALTAARPGMVRLAAPGEFEGLETTAPIWRVPAEKMKLTAAQRIDATHEFVIPLSRQAVETVRLAIELAGRHATLVFPSVKDQRAPISDSTLSKLYRDAGFRDVHVPHGWRATFSTRMNERAADLDRDGDRAIIDMMLAHIQAGVEPIYNRSAYMSRRRAIAQAWADMLMIGQAAPAALLIDQRGSSPRQARRVAHERGIDRRPARPAQKPEQSRPSHRSGTVPQL